MIITRGGTNLPLDQRRRDALANYAEQCAEREGIPKLTWIQRNWPLKVYEAKDLLKGNASEVVWERIIKARGPHGGWRIVIPVMGAVVGQALEDFIRAERAELEREAQQREREARELAQLEATLLRRPVVDVGVGSAVADRRADPRGALAHRLSHSTLGGPEAGQTDARARRLEGQSPRLTSGRPTEGEG